MSYNQASAEKQWRAWKEAEEKQLRTLGVEEDTIQRLHTYDWAQFNKERQYQQRRAEWPSLMDWVSIQDFKLPAHDANALLNSIENRKLLRILSNEDELTIEILCMKIDGYSSKEIASSLKMDERAVNMRVYRLRKKLKKIFELRYISALFLGYRVNGENLRLEP